MLGEKPSTRTKLPVLKIRGGMSSELVSASPDVLSFHTHWLGTRSYMCPGVDCPACFAGVGAKWLGLLGVRVPVPHTVHWTVHVLELTSMAYQKLLGLSRMCDCESLLGFHFAASRRSKKSTLGFEPLEQTGLPGAAMRVLPAWALLDAAATLYGLPSAPQSLSREEWEASAVPRAAQLLRAAIPDSLR